MKRKKLNINIFFLNYRLSKKLVHPTLPALSRMYWPQKYFDVMSNVMINHQDGKNGDTRKERPHS